MKQKIIIWILKGLNRDTVRRRIVALTVARKMDEILEAKNMKSWKTTLFGALGALGVYLTSVKDPEWVSVIGQFVSAISTFGLGMVARDNDKSSENVGAK